MGLLEAARPGLVGPGEGALFMAEQLALQQGLGQRRAIDRNQVGGPAGAVGVDGPGQKAFARAGFAGEQNGDVGFGDPGQLVQHPAHGRALRHHGIEVVDVGLFVAQVIHRILELGLI